MEGILSTRATSLRDGSAREAIVRIRVIPSGSLKNQELTFGMGLQAYSMHRISVHLLSPFFFQNPSIFSQKNLKIPDFDQFLIIFWVAFDHLFLSQKIASRFFWGPDCSEDIRKVNLRKYRAYVEAREPRVGRNPEIATLERHGGYVI